MHTRRSTICLGGVLACCCCQLKKPVMKTLVPLVVFGARSNFAAAAAADLSRNDDLWTHSTARMRSLCVCMAGIGNKGL